ncbi:MAG: flagellar basal body L-ring protein FlgH [Leptospiraceae bacterium]|nr:flagellar basal body L-ring protein FlgH [Leptospiraceae bacterium]
MSPEVREIHRRRKVLSSLKSFLFTAVASSAAAILIPFLFAAGLLRAEDLWKDKNPYGISIELQQGEILKLQIREPMVVDYLLEGDTTDEVQIKMVPDSKLFEFLPPADDTRTITEKKDARIRSRARLVMDLAVTIQSIDTNTGTVTFSGTKVLAYQSGTAAQQIQVSGRVNAGDIMPGKTIHSSRVADLQVIIQGGPSAQRENVQLQPQPDRSEGDSEPSTSLSDAEKQRLLLEYLNRILGESGEVSQ